MASIKVLMTFFWVKSRCDWLVEAIVSEKRSISIFRPEVMTGPINQPKG
jgi:hypothetical protein